MNPLIRFPIMFLFILSAIGTCLFFFFFRITPQDIVFYEKLLESSNPARTGTLASCSQQIRENVNKEIWFHGEQPLHVKIRSKESELIFFNDNNKIDVLEEMHSVSCMMQEEIYYLLSDGTKATFNKRDLVMHHENSHDESFRLDALPSNLQPMQKVRYLEAQKARYYYNTQLFIAHDVKLWEYELPGHEICWNLKKYPPLMKGVAANVEFSLKSNQLDFHASYLKAEFVKDL